MQFAHFFTFFLTYNNNNNNIYKYKGNRKKVTG